MDGARSQSFTQASVPDSYENFMLPQLFEPWARELAGYAQPAPPVTCAAPATPAAPPSPSALRSSDYDEASMP